MVTLGWFAAVLVGLALGLFGGGGGILAVPVLTYLLGVPATSATGYSMVVVGVGSLIGAGLAARDGNVDGRAAVWFAAPAVVTVYLTRRVLLPGIPDVIVGGLTRDGALMILFAGLMLAVGSSMVRPRELDAAPAQVTKPGLILAVSVLVGLVAGLVGAGGGFLIVPALVLLAGLPMKRAVGTSLLVIATQSLVGFTGELHRAAEIDWGLLAVFALLATTGVVAGSVLRSRVSGDRLRVGFGWFVVVMGVLVLVRELVALRWDL